MNFTTAMNRTWRSLVAAGVRPDLITRWDGLESGIGSGGAGLWIRAGVWLAAEGPLRMPPESPGGKPVVAVGLPRISGELRVAPTAESQSWQALQARCGGDFNQPLAAPLPLPPVFWAGAAASRELREKLRDGGSVDGAWTALVRRARVVRWPSLDVYADESPRVIQLITSLQRGGAERLALDLTVELRRQGTATWLLGLGRPTRPVFPAPAGWLDLAALDEVRQIATVQRLATRLGVDLLHAHLLDAETAADFARQPQGRDWPLVHTLHNTRAAWPAGLAERLPARGDSPVGFFACSQAIEAELRATGTKAFVRTIWNGIDAGDFAVTPERRREWRTERRRQLDVNERDLVLVAIANPRPQKRLERLPEILAECTRRRTAAGDAAGSVHLWLIGSASARSTLAQACEAAVVSAAAAAGVSERVHRLGDSEDVRPWLAAADVLVNVSDHEGLSLAQLEALAMGLPVVATAVGGAPEIAARTSQVHLLPVTAGAVDFAAAILRAVAPAVPSETEAGMSAVGLPATFTLPVMAARHRLLYERLLAMRRPGSPVAAGVCLITNNFSTGGAQTSARRLLVELARRGHRVRAITLQEPVAQPTPGTLALRAAGIPVLALPPPEELDAAETVRIGLRSFDADPPATVLAWNALAEYKLRWAEALEEIPFFDVSPGEMYFSALERVFRRPPAGLPITTATEYGHRLAGLVVKYAAEAARASVYGAPVFVQRNGVPLLPSVTYARRDRVVFGTAARLNPHKRLELLLSALRLALPRLPACELVIAGAVEPGGENYADELQAAARDLPVRWLGDVTDVPAWLGELDVFVMISEPAGCPNASLEALSVGLPVVVTDHGGAAEQVVDRVTGRLVGREDVSALAEALVELALDPALREQWGRAGRQRIATEFSLTQMADGYERLLGLKRGAPSRTA